MSPILHTSAGTALDRVGHHDLTHILFFASRRSACHTSDQHGTLLQRCNFTSIAVVRPPWPSSDSTTSGDTLERQKGKRWLVWLDKHRGLLGRTSFSCPILAASSPTRRRTIHDAGYRLPTTGEDQARCERGGRPKSERQISFVDHPSASIPAACASAALTTTAIATTVGDEHTSGQHGVRVKRSKDGSAALLVVKTSCVKDGIRPYRDAQPNQQQLQKGVARTIPRDAPRKEATVAPSSRSNAEDCADTILVRSLNKPIGVAGVPGAGQSSKGVFFIDHDNAVGEPGPDRKPTHLNPTGYDDGSGKAEPASRTGRLRLLQWGAHGAVTVANRLCNPTAFCVNANSSVFILEEVYRLPHVRGRGDRRVQYHRRERRHRVCLLRGDLFSAWLENQGPSLLAGEERDTVGWRRGTPPNGLTPESQGDILEERIRPNSIVRASENPEDEGSQTDWECSDTASSDGSDDEANEIIGSQGRAADTSTGSCGRRRGMIDLVEVFELPLPAARKGGGRYTHEHPVDLCVLSDLSVVVAFSRFSPLHDGAAVAVGEGLVRAFPATCRGKNEATQHFAGSINTDDHGFDSPALCSTMGKSAACTFSPTYDVHDSWLVAEGLPVITSISAACEKSAVYVSFCGAMRQDGTVTAVGCLPIRRRGQPAVPRNETSNSEKAGPRAAARNPRSEEEHSTRSLAEAYALRDGNIRKGCYRGRRLQRIVTGFAAALTVDEGMNL